MALIVPYQSQAGLRVASSGAPGQYMGAGTSATGQGLQKLASGMDKLNNAIFNIQIQKQRDIQALDVANDLNEVRESWNQYSTDYQNNNRGRLAANAENDAKAFWDEKSKAMREKWGHNDRVFSHIGQQIGTMALSGLNTMRQFANKGLDDYRNDTHDKEEKNALSILTDLSRPSAERDNAKSTYISSRLIRAQREGFDSALAEREAYIDVRRHEEIAIKAEQREIKAEQREKSRTLREIIKAQEDMRRYEKTALEEQVKSLIASGDEEGAMSLVASASIAPYGSKLSSLKEAAAHGLKNITPELNKYIENAALANGLSPELIRAIGTVESNWNVKAVSEAGARGPMQIKPSTARGLGIKNIDDPEENIMGGAKYFSEQLARYGGDEVLAAMAYNWGPTRVSKWLASGSDPDAVPSETRQYVQKLFGRTPGEKGVDVSADLVEKGNLDLTKRPTVKLADGSIATVRTETMVPEDVGESGKVSWKGLNIPTISKDGRELSREEAIENYKATGEHLGKYKTIDSAVAAAEQLHVDQERMYVGTEQTELMRRPLLTPADTMRYQRMISKSANEKRLITNYQQVYDSMKGMPREEQDVAFTTALAQIPDPEMRSKMKTMWDKDRSIDTLRQDSLDSSIAKQFEDQVKQAGLNFSQALAEVPNLKQHGLSDEAEKKLIQRLEKGRDVETKENLAATDIIRQMIDMGQVTESSQVETYAFHNGLTEKQEKEVRQYLDDGGKEGATWQLRNKIDSALKYYNNDKGLKENPELFDRFVKSMDPGQRPTEEFIRKRVISLLEGGEAKGGGVGYGRDMTYGEAVAKGKGDEWLPNIDSDEMARMRGRFRAQGINDLTDNELRWIKRKEQGLPVPTEQIRAGIR